MTRLVSHTATKELHKKNIRHKGSCWLFFCRSITCRFGISQTCSVIGSIYSKWQLSDKGSVTLFFILWNDCVCYYSNSSTMSWARVFQQVTGLWHIQIKKIYINIILNWKEWQTRIGANLASYKSYMKHYITLHLYSICLQWVMLQHTSYSSVFELWRLWPLLPFSEKMRKL